MEKNKFYKGHFRLYFQFDFTYKTYLSLFFISELFNELFKKFPTLYDYIKWRKNNFGGYHPCYLSNKNGFIVFYIDFIFVNEELLNISSSWLEEIISLLFDEKQFNLQESSFNNEKKKCLLKIKESQKNALYVATRKIYEISLNNFDYACLNPLNEEEILKLTIDDIKNTFVSLKDHLFHVSSFNLSETKKRKLKQILPQYEEKRFPFIFLNIAKENIIITKKEENVLHNAYSLLFKIANQKYFYDADLLYYYLKDMRSFLFKVIREKYGLIYSYEVNVDKHDNFFSICLIINKDKISLLKKIINDFLINPSKYINLNEFKEMKNEYLNNLISLAKSQEYVYTYNDVDYYNPPLKDLSNYVKYIKHSTYKTFLKIISTIKLVNEYYLEGVK